MIIVTGASGQLGRLVIASLLKKVPAHQIGAAVRSPNKVADLKALGVNVLEADYTKPASLAAAFKGAEKVLLISSNEVGQRTPQHKAVIDAAKEAGVSLIAYTSLLHADTSPLPLAKEHAETEALLKQSGVPYVLLRNGWYIENHLAGLPAVLQHNVVLGSAGEGRFAAAARADYAEAAAVALTADNQANRIYELAGDVGYTLADYAAEVSRQTGKTIPYNNLPEADFIGILKGAGLPEAFAQLLATSDTGASKGGLFDDAKQLSQLIGRPTTSLAELLKGALK